MQAKVSYYLTPANAKQWETIFTDFVSLVNCLILHVTVKQELNGTLEAMEPEVEADILGFLFICSWLY